MRRVNNLGKKISIFAIILAFIVTILGIIIFNVLWKGKSNENNAGMSGQDGAIQATMSSIPTIEASDLYYDNYWSKSIIKEIAKDDVPIPNGMEYESGTKETGVIVKDTKTGTRLLWIPYDESVTEGAKEYFKNCDYKEMDADTQEAIEHYGGFFVTLEKQNYYNKLKNVDEKSYEAAYKNASKTYAKSDTVNSHLVHKFELAQIEAYSKKIGVDLLKVGMKKQTNDGLNVKKVAFSTEDGKTNYLGITSVTPEIYETSANNESVAINLKAGSETKTVICPGGFKWYEKGFTTDGETGGVNNYNNQVVFKIQDIKNPNLTYIWVPVNDLDNSSSSIKSKYDEQNQKFYYDSYQSLNNDTYQELLQSVADYGGFYIAEAELGYTSTGAITNKARGMNLTADGHTFVNDGNYYRGTELKDYNNAVEVAANLHSENNNVVSHLMYGTEYDAALLWLLNSNAITDEQLIKDSSTVAGAKYEGTFKDEVLEDYDLKATNGIYGMAGNLFELTQEFVEYSENENEKSTWIVARSGSYVYPGNEFSMASRITLKDEIIKESDDVGIRNCLFLNKDAIENAKYFDITEKGEVSLKQEYKNNTVENLEIPSSVNGIEVKSIKSEGFNNCTTLKSIVLPDGLKEIGDYAFSECTSLENLEMSINIEKIGKGAFAKCSSLKEIDIPDKLQKINDMAFENCLNLEKANIDATSLSEIGNSVFSNDSNLKTIIFETNNPNNGVIKINNEAFKNCSGINIYVTKNIENQIKNALNNNKSISKIDTSVSLKILWDQGDAIYAYSTGYVFGPINDPVYNQKVNTAVELVNYFEENKTKLKDEEMDAKLTEIRQNGEKAIEELMKQYRETTYDNEVEKYTANYHSEFANEQWVIDLKNDTKNKITAENNMNNVYDLAIEYQVKIGEKAGSINNAKKYYIKIIGDYVPYVGWDYGNSWISGMNSIKSDYIAKIGKATSEEEVKSLQLACEAEIENYVNPIVKQRAQEEAAAAAVARARLASSSSSTSSVKSTRTYSSGSSSKKSNGSNSSGKSSGVKYDAPIGPSLSEKYNTEFKSNPANPVSGAKYKNTELKKPSEVKTIFTKVKHSKRNW